MDKRLRRKLDLVANQVITAYTENFLTLKEIAELYGVHLVTVSKFLEKHKVKKRRRGARHYSDRKKSESLLNEKEGD